MELTLYQINDAIEKLIDDNVNPETGEKIETPQLSISWRKSSSVVEPDEFDLEKIEKLYPSSVRIKKELDKTEAKNMLKNVGIAGLKIEEKSNIQIK